MESILSRSHNFGSCVLAGFARKTRNLKLASQALLYLAPLKQIPLVVDKPIQLLLDFGPGTSGYVDLTDEVEAKRVLEKLFQ